jgi:ribonuclease BN (tRNA processing enzyme)
MKLHFAVRGNCLLKTMHSTAIEAATIALKANVQQLLLGHQL